MFVAPQDRDRYEQRPYKPFTADFLGRILTSADLFVDVGAHYGFFSLLAGSLHPKLKILAIEPAPDTCALLRRNIELLNTSNVDLHRVAASDVAGRAKLVVSSVADECSFYARPSAPALPPIDVETLTVDLLLKGLDSSSLVVKICTQGSELAILKGMAETFQRIRDVKLIIEFNPEMQIVAGLRPDAILKHLDGLGFDVHLLNEEQRQFCRLRPNTNWESFIKTGFANLYCIRRESALSMCFFSHTSGLAGAERMLLELVDDLVADHGAVCSVVLPGGGPLVKLLEQAGAACIVALPYGWWCTDNGATLADSVKNQAIAENIKSLMGTAMPAVRQLDPDAVWTQTMVIPWGAVFAAELGKPHVWYVTEFGERDFGFNFYSPLAQVSREIVNSSDLVFTCSKIVAQTVFPHAYRNRVRVLYCHVPMPAQVAAPDQRSFFRIPGAIKLGIFGQVRPSKGQQDVVRAIAQLSSRGRNVELLIAGDGRPADMQTLATMIRDLGVEERVNLAGFIMNPYPAMQAADILIVSSRMEAFGRVGVEAMLLGKPLVFAAAGGVSEYMIDGRTGLSYTPGDVDGLVVQLEKLLDDPERRRLMGDCGHAHATELFSKEKYSGEVYRSLQQLRAQGRVAAGMPKSIEKVITTTAGMSAQVQSARIGRNVHCYCGSGKKYKHCHGRVS